MACSLRLSPQDLVRPLSGQARASVGLVLEFSGRQPVGVRAMSRALLAVGDADVIMVAVGGFTSGARAVAAARDRVQLYERRLL